MTVLKSTVPLPLNKETLREGGALAASAWAVLCSKLSDTEDILLNQSIPDHDGEEPSQHLISVTHDSSVRTIIDRAGRAAYSCEGFRLWRLSLPLPIDHSSGSSPATTQLLIFETESPNWTWQELDSLGPGKDAHLLLLASQSPPGDDSSHVDFGLYSRGASHLSATRTQRLFQQFLYALDQLVKASPSGLVGDVSLISSRDVADIERWNEKPVEPVLDCVHFAIERRARETPDAEAVCAWDGNLTYRELSSASTRLAKRLIALGVGPEVFVPVCFEKSVWAIVAMVAILKAGGAIVPLNPDHPAARQKGILHDVGASVLVSSELHQDLARGLHENVVVEVLNQATLHALDSDDSDAGLARGDIGPSSPVFAVFTSGSTGVPKGIIIEHGAMCASVRDHGPVMRFGRHTRAIQFAAYTFDDSFSDIFTTLMFGGCICVPSDHDRLNDLAGSIVRMDANHACLTVTVASQLRPLEVPCLRTLIVGGEKATARILAQWADHVYLINSYGPAEASIFCSANSGLSRRDDAANVGVGVGCLLHIADAHDHNRLVPIGAIGELLIEGPILARGYIHNDTKTSQSFISNPNWASSPRLPRRFYKTGDLARYNEDGTVVVLGRKDTQVKLYGQRIELGEIEHHLRAELAQDCRDVVAEVLKLKTASGTLGAPMIVAFLQFTHDNAGSEAATPDMLVRADLPHGAEERLRKVMPAYMIPSAFLKLREMPLMVSGKLDRKRLREMASQLSTKELMGQSLEAEGPLGVPETAREKVLQALWAEVLGIDSSCIWLESRFFRLGGDSVAAMKLVSVARGAGIRITVEQIFQRQTLREQSAASDFVPSTAPDAQTVEPFSLLKDRDIVGAALTAIRRYDPHMGQDGILDMYPCSPLQTGIMALSAKTPGSYVAQMAYKLPGHVDVERLKLAWESVVRCNAILRTRIVQAAENDSTLWQVVVTDEICWVEDNSSLESYLASDKQLPMTIGSRLARFALVRKSEGTGRVHEGAGVGVTAMLPCSDQPTDPDLAAFSSTANPTEHETNYTGSNTRVDDCPPTSRSEPGFWFVWTLHHAVFDDDSQRLLLRSVERAYHGSSSDPHLEFNVFIKYILSQTDTKASAPFWMKQLENPPSPSFPALPEPDYLPLADQTVRRSLDYDSDSLRASDVTLSTFLRAAWAILLAQYSESHDVVFGVTVNGRSLSLDGVETTSGPTFATVPLRVVVDRDTSIRAFLLHLQQQYVSMIPHEQAGLQSIARWVPEVRNVCNFQSLLIVQAADQTPGGGDSLLGSPELLGSPAGFLTHALTVECRPTLIGSVDLQIHFDSHILQTIQVERVSRQFEHILRQLTKANSHGGTDALKSLELVSESDIELLRVWNVRSHDDDRVDELLHQGFYEQLRLRPSAPAVEDYDSSLTYAELEDLSSRLARSLVAEFRQQTGHFVPMCCEKSPLAVVAALAILKTGGALVMLDPSFPPSRLNHIVAMANASFIVFSPETAANLAPQMDVPALTLDRHLLDRLPQDTEQSDCKSFQIPVDPSHPACLILTSGSTGTPKGTVMSHRAWASGARKHADAMGMTQLKPLRVLQFAGLSFDMSIAEIFTTLSLGGCVCIVPENERTAEGVVRAINRLRVNWAFLSSTFATLLEKPSSMLNLRTVVFGGEAAPPKLFSHFPSTVQLIQAYGPSECTPITFVSTHLDPKVPGNVGRAIIGSSWIVDPFDPGRLAPVGALGELLIGGPHIGNGYLGDSVRTSRAFIQPPPWTRHFSSVQQGQHMYLTGDLFHYDTDGSVIYAGRKDTQVKVRGQRVELAEIEHHLRPLIPEATSIVAELVSLALQDRKMLVAYLCIPPSSSSASASASSHSALSSRPSSLSSRLLPSSQSSPPSSPSSSSSSLLSSCMVHANILLPPSSLDFIDLPSVITEAAASLPRYMIPNVFIPIRRVPFMPVSRKVDRRMLREVASDLDVSSLRPYTVHHQDKKLPQTRAEVELRALFASVLGLEEQSVSVNDSFLLLGGDSIDAMRLVALAKSRNSLSLSVGMILQRPVLADLARMVSRSGDDDYSTGSDAATAVVSWELLRDGSQSAIDSVRAEAVVQCQLSSEADIEDAYPCTPFQEGVFALSMAHPGTYFSQHVFVAPPFVDEESFKAAWEELFQGLGIFRTRIIQLASSGELVQVVVREPLQWIVRDDLDAYLRHDQKVPFSLGGALGRFAVIRTPESNSHAVVWTAHHSVYDGFSVSLITAALETALSSGAAEDTELAQKADFRHYVRYVNRTDVNTCLGYWKTQFSNLNSLELPPVASRVSHDIKREVLIETLPYSQTQTTVTGSSIIRAAWALTVARYTGSPDVVFGAIVSGRDSAIPSISDIIGPTLSTVPVRVTLDYAESVCHYVERVQQQAVGMVDFQHAGLQTIRRSSSEAEAACQFQNLLVVQPSSFGKEAKGLIKHQFGTVGNRVETHTYPMVISCDVAHDSVEIKALYDSHVVELSLMQRILKLFGRCIIAVAHAASDATVLALLRHHQPDLDTLHSWNSRVPLAVEECIHKIIPFKTRASQLAVQSWDGHATYAELDATSTTMAHHLVSLGVGPEMLVPLCFRKSLWAVVAVFSVLKAGGAPVFLNAELSLDRLSGLIEFMNAEVLLTSAHMFPNGARPVVKRTVEVDRGLVDSLLTDNVNRDTTPLPRVHAHNMAFAAFTSGTTGLPKCIILEHRNVSTLMSLYSTVGEFKPGARVLQFASHTFDAIIKDILATTLNGCTLYIPSEEDRMNNLTEYMRTHQITQATLTPTIGALFGPADVPNLNVLVLAGEKMTPDNLATWAPAVHLNNAYGPSETTGRTSCQSGVKVDSDPSNIGRALGCVCWIVDPDDPDLLVPIGAVGEIVVEGPTVSRGYLKSPEKTAAAFIPPPEWVPAERRHSRNRLYRTGDLARLNADGSMTILGRKDAQVKLHGQRIELEEVESAFKRHLPADVGLVVEMVQSRSLGDGKHNHLLAAFLHEKTSGQVGPAADLQFISPRSTSMLADLDMHQVCRAVRASLASYMLPSVFLAINRLPLLPSTKTDRKILRALYANANPSTIADSSAMLALFAHDNIQPPATHRQERLRKIVAAALRLDEMSVGLNHSFLQLGGDSISAMRFVSAARAEQIGLTVAGILQRSSLQALDDAAIDLAEQRPTVSIEPFALLRPNTDKGLAVAEAAAQCGISADLVEDIYPCTPLQEGIMALSIQQTGDYVARRTFALPEDVNIPRLQSAWNTVAQQIPILRTRIVQTSTGLCQVVVSGGIAWSSALESLADVSMGLGDVLNRLASSSKDKTLIWVSHHATYDGVSAPMILELVGQIYRDTPPSQRSLIADYRLFIQYITQLSSEASHSYWSSQLAGASLEPFPSIPSQVAHVSATSRLRSVVLAADTPSSSVIRAAWALVMASHTSSHDPIFGSVLYGRDSPVQGIDRMVGPTITTVPIRVHIDPKEDTGAFLARLQDQAVAMIPHEHFGLQNIRRISEEARQACDFHNLLVIHAAQETPSDEPPPLLKIEDGSGDGPASLDMNTYPLVLEVQLLAEGYLLEVSYDQSIISPTQMERIVRQMEHVVQKLSSRQQSKVCDVEVLSPPDREEIWQWNSTIPETAHETLHHLIEQRARLSPDAEAIASWDGSMTYSELDRASSILAHEIRSQDGIVGSFVALCFEKSLWVVVAMLAVLRAGNGFAFLDPCYPPERLRHVAGILNPVLAISSVKHQDLCRELMPNTIALGLETLDKSNGATTGPSVAVSPSDPVCAIFTSGTTGLPKGAILSHRSYVTSQVQLVGKLSLDSATRMLHFASYSFDAAVFETLTTLMVGGCVCIPDEQYRNINIDVEIERMNVNCTLLTPSFATLLSPERVPNLKSLILAGEPITTKLINTWSDRVSLHNVYGPSECSVVSTLVTNISRSTPPLNIGRASSGATWIVDQDNPERLVPIGAPGELLLEGPLIGEGYISDRDQTKAAFLERPPHWWSRPSNGQVSPFHVNKFYRTGDIVKYAPDGSLIFVRRKDNQAKIHGQRVEMGDIENHLATVPGVGHAIVLIPKSGLLTGRLVAVISVRDGEAVSGKAQQRQQHQQAADLALVPDLRRTATRPIVDAAAAKLSAELPNHMVPNFWVPLESLPVLLSGKLDRKGVSAWLEDLDEQTWQKLVTFAAASSETAEEEILTSTEATLRLLWHQVLNVDVSAINRQSSFLRLGGDSISAMQLMSKARDVGLRLNMWDIVRSKNLGDLAQSATPLATCVGTGERGRAETVSPDTLFELSPIQKLYFEVSPEGNNAFEQSMLLRIAKTVPESLLSNALEEIVKHHAQLRARYTKASMEVWKQSISRFDPEKKVLRVHHQASVVDMPRIVSESKQRLNLKNGPLFVAELVKRADDRQQYLFLCAHHLSVDLVSWRIILQDLEELCLRRVETLSDTSLSFPAWCSLQAQYCQQLNPTRFIQLAEPFDIGYWGIQGGTSNTYSDIFRCGFVLNKSTTASILGECNSAFASTPVDTFVAAAIISFGRVFPDRSLPTVFLEGHGREPWSPSIDVLRTVGWFTTLFPLSLTAHEARDIVTAVRTVKDLRNQFSDNGFASFTCSKLLPQHDNCDSSRHKQSSPVAEITLNYLGQYQQLERDDALFRMADMDLSAEDKSSQERFSLFNITVQVRNGKIHVDFSYNRHSLKQDLMARWVRECERCLEEGAAALPILPRTYTRRDFPLLQLSYQEFEALLGETLSSRGIDIEAVEDMFPCSPTQLEMLQAEEDATSHHMTRLNFEVTNTEHVESVDPNRLAEAFGALIKRHPILRTVFVPVGGRNDKPSELPSVQLVLKTLSLPAVLQMDAYGEFSESEPAHTDAVYKKLCGGKPPYQLTFRHVAARKAIFVSLDISHALIDGASMAVLLRDWDRAYQGRLPSGTAPGYQPLVRLIQDRSAREALSYWTEHLSELKPSLIPILESPSGSKDLHRQQRFLPLRLPPMVSLQAVCRETSTTLPNLFHAVWAIALHLATGSRDIAYGYLTSGRDVAAALDGAVGPYFNLLIARHRIEDHNDIDDRRRRRRMTTIGAVLRAVQATMTAQLPHHHFSWSEMKGLIMPEERKPVFNTLINIHRFAPLQSAGEEKRILEFAPRRGYDPLAYDVELNGKIENDVVKLSLTWWSTSVTDEWASGFRALLERIVHRMLLDLDSDVKELGQNLSL